MTAGPRHRRFRVGAIVFYQGESDSTCHIAAGAVRWLVGQNSTCSSFSKKLLATGSGPPLQFLSSAQNPCGVLHPTKNSGGGVLGFSKKLFLSSGPEPYVFFLRRETAQARVQIPWQFLGGARWESVNRARMRHQGKVRMEDEWLVLLDNELAHSSRAS